MTFNEVLAAVERCLNLHRPHDAFVMLEADWQKIESQLTEWQRSRVDLVDTLLGIPIYSVPDKGAGFVRMFELLSAGKNPAWLGV